MAIFKIFYRTFMTMFLTLILFVNLVMFVTMLNGGASPSGFVMYGNWDFQHYYFGFSSLINAFNGLTNIIDYYDFLFACRDFWDSLVTTFPPVNNPTNILGWVWFIGNALTFGMIPLARAFVILVQLVKIVVQLMIWLSVLFGGAYNIPLPTY